MINAAPTDSNVSLDGNCTATPSNYNHTYEHNWGSGIQTITQNLLDLFNVTPSGCANDFGLIFKINTTDFGSRDLIEDSDIT